MRNRFEVYSEVNRPEMLDFVPQGASRILDVGCSTGNFGRLIKDSRPGSEVWGVEIDEDAAAVAADRLDRVINQAFSRTMNLTQKFDCIVFNDVLEHMVDPYSALAFGKNLLTDNGCIVASIPNVRFFDNVWELMIDKNWEYRDAGILDRTHLRFFTRRTIASMFQNAGLLIDRLEGINPIEGQSYRAKRFRILNTFLLNRIEDMQWLQFAVVAKATG